MSNIYDEIEQLGIVPVIKIDDVNDAVPLAKALINGGLPIAEITFRTEAAAEAIKSIVDTYPDMLIGAGTVLSVEQVKIAVESGAQFIVSPGFNEKTIEYCLENNITVIPGCSSASDLEKAMNYGLEVVKFFPAEASGGLSVLKALSAPYGNLKFMPTGGINLENLNDYLDFEKVIACGGTWMVQTELIKQGKFDVIKKETERAIDKMLNLRIRCLYGKEYRESKLLNHLFHDEDGYVILETTNIKRAKYHLNNSDVKFIYNEQNGFYETHDKINGYRLRLDEVRK